MSLIKKASMILSLQLKRGYLSTIDLESGKESFLL